MKKIFLYLIFLILLINIALAETVSYQGWIYNTKTFDFDGTLYRVLISNNGNTLILNAETTISVSLGNCYSKDYTKFCYNISTYDIDQKDYKAYIYVSYRQPEIEIERDVDNNILEVGEEASFITILENIGDEDAEDVVFLEDFPENVEITRVKNADIKDRSVYWKGDLDAGDTRTIEYDIKSLGKIDQYIKSSVNYFDGFEQQQVFSEQIRLYSTPILSITLDTDKEDYEIDEDIDFTLNIKNNGDKDIDVNELNINIPNNIEVEKKSSVFDLIDSKYVWDGTLSQGQNKTFSFDLKAKNIGLSFIVVNGDYKYKNINHEIPNTQHGFLVHNEGIELTSSLDSTEYVNSNEIKRIYVKVMNQNSFSNINDLVFRVSTELPGFENHTYSNVGTNDTIYLLDTEIRMPNLEAEKAYKIRFNLSYKTEDGDLFSEKLDRVVVVRPIKKIVITPSFSSTTPNEKDPITITVKAKNPGSNTINSVSISSVIPELFTIKGATSSYFSINSSEEKEVLSFTLIPDLVNYETDANITFHLNYVNENKEYDIDSSTLLKISPVIPDMSVEKKVSKSELYEGEMFTTTYTIKNNDDKPVYDLKLYLTQDQYFDSLNVFNYTYDKLDPGETLIFDKEELRAKKLGTFTLKDSILYFKDENERIFNKSASQPQITIKESHIQGPALVVMQNSSEEAITNKPYLIEIKFTNFGNKPADIIINGNSQNIEEEFIYYEEKIFENPGTYTIPKKYYEYDYMGNIARVYTNELTVNVIKEIVIDNEINNNETISDNITNTDIDTEPVQKKSFFGSIYRWFKNLFTKRG